MIDRLESRMFLSATAHAALTSLRVEVGSIGHWVNELIVSNNSAIANLQNDLSIFPTAGTSDKLNLRGLNFQFRSRVSTLANDYNDQKVLLGQDITQLINVCNAYNRAPSAGAGLVVQASQQQLTAQAVASSTSINQDSNSLKTAYDEALALVQNSHPLDTTMVDRVSHISAALSANITRLQSIASMVALTEVPNFITALEPEGIITAAA